MCVADFFDQCGGFFGRSVCLVVEAHAKGFARINSEHSGCRRSGHSVRSGKTRSIVGEVETFGLICG